MCPACLTTLLAAVAVPAAGGVAAVALIWPRDRSAKQPVEPPSPTFQEWIAAIEASVPFAVTNGPVSKPLEEPKHPFPTGNGTGL